MTSTAYITKLSKKWRCCWFVLDLLSRVFFYSSSNWCIRLINIHRHTTFLYRQREIHDTFYNRAQSLSFLPSADDETLRYGTTIFNKKRNLVADSLQTDPPPQADEPLMACEGDSLSLPLTTSQLMLSQRLPLSVPQHVGYDRTLWNTMHVCCRKVASYKNRKWHFNAFLLIWKDQRSLNIDWVVHVSYTDGW